MAYLNPSDLPDIRRYLREDEHDCLVHIKNNTFKEEPFVDYFVQWEKYIYVLINFPYVKDEYDASSLPTIAKYYNTHTRTYNHYDEGTGKKK